MSDADFEFACVSHADFRRAVLKRSTWSYVYGHDVDLRRAYVQPTATVRGKEELPALWHVLVDARSRISGLRVHTGGDPHAKTHDAACSRRLIR
jgi:hypothetical protein